MTPHPLDTRAKSGQDSSVQKWMRICTRCNTQGAYAPSHAFRARFLLPALRATLWSGTEGSRKARRFLECGSANPPLPGHHFALGGLASSSQGAMQ
jgi:hypothetical protein